MKTRSIRVAGACALVVLALSACDATDSGNQPFNDAPVDKSVGSKGVQDGPAVIVNMPDGFNNLAYKCVGTTLFVSTYHGSSSYAGIAVVPNSVLCKGSQ